MNTANTEITTHKIIVIEWLSDKDDHTGQKLYEDVIRHKTSSSLLLSSEYHNANDANEFKNILEQITYNHKDGQIVTLDIETHGSEYGIGIDSKESISWKELFYLTRPINENCGGLLVITLSCCFGLSHLIAIEPKERAPFLAIVSSNREMYPEELYDCFCEFFKRYENPLSIKEAMSGLHLSFAQQGKESPFALTTSLQWFDEFFREERIAQIAEQKASRLAHMEGIDEECAKYQIIEDMLQLCRKHRSYFNFFDVLGIDNIPKAYIVDSCEINKNLDTTSNAPNP